MAFIRRKKQGGRTYYDLVESYREDDKVKQRVILHLPTPKVTERLAQYVLVNGRTEVEVQTFEPIDSSSSLLLSVLWWFTYDYEQAKMKYRWALEVNRRPVPEYQWDYNVSDFEEFERLRARIFKLYRIITTLRRYAPESSDTAPLSRRKSEADRESKATLRRSVKSIVRHRRKVHKTTS